MLVALAAPLAAGVMARRAGAQDVPVMQQAVTVSLADAVQDRYSARIEPLVFGRFSIGISGEVSTRNDGYSSPIAYVGCPVNRLCADPVTALSAPAGPGYREWSFAAHGRWYPAALARANARQSIAFYVGESVGYRERRRTETYVNPCAWCAQPVLPDTTGGYYPFPGGTTTNSYTFSAWEPGAEFGVRIGAARHLVIDVGSSFRMVRLDDYQSSQRRGDIDSRLAVSVGIGW